MFVSDVALSLVYVLINSLTDLVVRLFFPWWQPKETGPCSIDLEYTAESTNRLVSSLEEMTKKLKLEVC